MIYSELVVFKLDRPLPVPDIRSPVLTCVPVCNVREDEDGNITHSPLSLAIASLGTETVFANFMMELLDLLFDDGIVHQQVALVDYDISDDSIEPCIESVTPLNKKGVEHLRNEAIVGVDLEEFVEW